MSRLSDSNKPVGFVIVKNLNPPAKIIGLFYNTFFVFILVSLLIFMLCSSKGFYVTIAGVIVIFIIYISLFFFQTKFGPKKVMKYFNHYIQPINYLKNNKSFQK